MRLPKYLPLTCTIILALLIVWRSPLSSSLWLDETMSVWAAQGSVSETLDKSLATIPHPPLYFILLKAAPFVPGSLEFGYRFLSIVSIAVASLIIFFLLGGGAAGFLGIALFITHDAVLKSAFSARPYALGVCAAAFLLWALAKLSKQSTFQHFALALLAALFAFYFVYPYGLLFLLLGWGIVERRRVAAMPDYAAVALWITLLAPGLYHLYTIYTTRASVRFVLAPTITELITTLLPSSILMIVVAVLVFAPMLGKTTLVALVRSLRLKRNDIRALALWSVPPVFIWAFSVAADSSLFLDRYFAYYAIGCAVLIASLIAKLPKPEHLCLTCILILCGREAVRSWSVEDWRGALHHAAETKQPVLMSSGYFELSRWRRPLSPVRRSYLLSPLAPYPVNLPSVPVLSFADADAQAAEVHTALLELGEPKALAFVCLQQTLISADRSSSTLCGRAESALTRLGYKQEKSSEFGQVEVQSWRSIQ